MFPLKDNIPTERFPILTVLLIALNIAVFAWQLSFSGDRYSSPELRELGVPERDENTLEYGAIPYRLTHPGEDCAVGTLVEQGSQRAEVVCQGTPEYAEAEARGEQGRPFEPLDSPPGGRPC